MDIQGVITRLGIKANNSGVSTGLEWLSGTGGTLTSNSPVDGKVIASCTMASDQEYEQVMAQAQAAMLIWRNMPAPKRGEIVRQMGNEFRKYKADLGALVSYEMGKSYQEGLGEVQEIIDICDFAVGLSRQLYGLTMHSERPNHRMYEQWHALGIVGIISAFNFPVAVWSWNSMLAWVCGNVCVWKPSEKTPLSAIACQNIIATVLRENSLPEGISNLVVGNSSLGVAMAADTRLPLISATGSTRMGKAVGAAVGARLGRSLLELGGNNAIIVSQHADLKMVLTGVVFGACGTAGQRCTTTRRVIVHESIYNKTIEVLQKAYSQLKIGNPLDETNHVGPLIDTDAVASYEAALKEAVAQGATIIVAGGVLTGPDYESGCYVKPCIVAANNSMPIVQHETFAPILYIMKYNTIEEAIAMQNNVPQGLSSAVFTNNLQEAELFLSVNGSDCGIANINIGTSGAEIGGAFGGEKETGGGRESGSDSWKAYMRRQTNTINYGKVLPLAQGIKFDI
jgi:aldehyde dehydrogenase (NAD+)